MVQVNVVPASDAAPDDASMLPSTKVALFSTCERSSVTTTCGSMPSPTLVAVTV